MHVRHQLIWLANNKVLILTNQNLQQARKTKGYNLFIFKAERCCFWTKSICVLLRVHFWVSMDENTQRNKKPNTKDEDITSLVIFLSQWHTNGWLNKAETEEAIDHFSFKKSSIQSIWKKARPGVLDPSAKVDLMNKKKGQSSSKQKYNAKDLEVMTQIPLSQRITLMSLSFAIHIP